jgi:ribonuclease BN (tRNA processing enzyme)
MSTKRGTEPELQNSQRAGVATFADAIARGAPANLEQVVAAETAPQAIATGHTGRTTVFLLGSQGGQHRTQLTGANFRAGTSVVVVVDGVVYLVDAGVGALLRLNEAGIDANAVRHVFLTHHHSDHTADLGNVMGFAWSSGRSSDASQRRLDVWGPPGTLDYVAGYQQSLALNIADQEGPFAQRPLFREFVHPHEFPLRGRILTHPMQIMRDARVAVWAIRVNHGNIPAVGYRIKTVDLDIALSGDRGTRGDHLARLIEEPDVLLHEITDTSLVIPALQQEGFPDSFIEHQLQDHSPPALVAGTANAARAKRLILYHLVPGNVALTDAYWQSLLVPKYKGELIVGKDLLEIA